MSIDGYRVSLEGDQNVQNLDFEQNQVYPYKWNIIQLWKWTIDICYNIDEPWTHKLSERSQIQRLHFAWFHLYNIFRMLLLLLSRFSRVWLCATPWTAAHQAQLSLGFSRQELWSGLPFPSPVHESEKWKWSRSVASDSQRPHGLQPTRLLRPWDFSRQEYWSGMPLPSSRI